MHEQSARTHACRHKARTLACKLATGTAGCTHEARCAAAQDEYRSCALQCRVCQRGAHGQSWGCVQHGRCGAQSVPICTQRKTESARSRTMKETKCGRVARGTRRQVRRRGAHRQWHQTVRGYGPQLQSSRQSRRRRQMRLHARDALSFDARLCAGCERVGACAVRAEAHRRSTAFARAASSGYGLQPAIRNASPEPPRVTGGNRRGGGPYRVIGPVSSRRGAEQYVGTVCGWVGTAARGAAHKLRRRWPARCSGRLTSAATDAGGQCRHSTHGSRGRMHVWRELISRHRAFRPSISTERRVVRQPADARCKRVNDPEALDQRHGTKDRGAPIRRRHPSASTVLGRVAWVSLAARGPNHRL
jgi:hypothetical protein